MNVNVRDLVGEICVAITMALDSDYSIETTVMRASATTVKVSVKVSTTSASTVPYVTFTDVTATLSATTILKTTGTAGIGSAVGDIKNKISKVFLEPA